MTEEEKNLEEMMAPEEREVFERYKPQLGKIYIPPNDQEAMENEKAIYFWGLGKEATWTWIKRWATINEDYNALWFDEDYAKKSRWGGIIAPPLYLISVNDGLAASMQLWYEFHLPGAVQPNTEKFPNFIGGPQGESEWEFFEPVRQGDIIDAEHKLTNFTWHRAKEGRPYSRICYVTGETTYINQKGQLIAKNRSTGLLLFK